jgi:hypothetical protein
LSSVSKARSFRLKAKRKAGLLTAPGKMAKH